MAFISGTGLNTTTGATITVPAGSSRMGVIAVPFECTTVPSPITATLNGVSLGTATVVSSSVGIEAVAVWTVNDALLTTIGAGSQAFAVNMTGGSGIQGRQVAYGFFSGRSQGTPVITTNNATSPPASVSCTALGANADIAAAAGFQNSGAQTDTAGFTSIYNATDAGGDAQGAMEYQAGVTAGAYSPGYTSSGTPQWAMVGVVLEALGLPSTASIAWVV